MSSPVVSPEPAKKEFNWKELFVKAAGFGAGFTLMLTILAGAAVWYWNRPKPPKPWDTKAITARFESFEISTQNGVLEAEIRYSIQNNTNEDYRITSESSLMTRNLDTGDLDAGSRFGKRVDVFIPAKHKAAYDVLMLYGIGKEAPIDVVNTSVMKPFLYKEFHNIDGFSLFDEQKRYEIVLPNGWKDMKAD